MSARRQADQVADRMRDELLATLGELERRRRRAIDLQLQLRQHWRGLLLAACAAGAAVVAVGVVSARRRNARPRWKRARRHLTAQRQALRKPDRPVERLAGGTVWLELARKVLLAFGSAIATRLARRTVAAMLPERAEHRKGELFLH